MQLFLYEDITGGGCSDPPAGSLLVEGRAMRDALADDFSRLDEIDEIIILQDDRLSTAGPAIEAASQDKIRMELTDRKDFRVRFRQLAAAADWSLVIAPEFEDRLLLRCEDVEAAGGKLLGPDSSLVALCSDKYVLLDHLRSMQVPTPRFARMDVAIPDDFPFPAVLKPRFGAGSADVRLLPQRDSLPEPLTDYCLEQFAPGRAVSVFVMNRPGWHVVFPVVEQRLGGGSGFEYQGGAGPLAPVWQQRCEQLVAQVLPSLPDFSGHVGLDLVLDEENERVTLIEINPRVTTSYVGLRHLIDRNLAACMLEVERGERFAWQLSAPQVRFTADGDVTKSAPSSDMGSRETQL